MFDKTTYKNCLLELTESKFSAAHDKLVLAELISRLEEVSSEEVERLYAAGYLDLNPIALISTSTAMLKDGLNLMDISSNLRTEEKSTGDNHA